MTNSKSYDVAVVGAGVFGAWIALHLARRQQRFAGGCLWRGHSRASSGGESRIIRMGYGADELYTRWAVRSLAQWKELFGSGSDRRRCFTKRECCGWRARRMRHCEVMTAVLTRCKVPFEVLDRGAIDQRYPQFNPEGLTGGVLETTSGVLMGRRAVAREVERAAAE